MVQKLSTNTFGCAKWIVSADATQGTHTTIATALTSASSGDTIFIRPGEYTENITLKAGVNLAGFNYGNVTIKGKTTFSSAGTFYCSMITFKTNGDYCIELAGNSATIVKLSQCRILGTDHNPINYSTASTSALFGLRRCDTEITDASYNLFDNTSTGIFNFEYCNFDAAAAVASNHGAGNLNFFFCVGIMPISCTGSSYAEMRHCFFNNLDTVSVAMTDTCIANVAFSYLFSGTASVMTVGAGTRGACYHSIVQSANTNVLTGAGALFYFGVEFGYGKTLINVTTTTGGLFKGGIFQAPSSGYIGEHVKTVVGPVTMVSGATQNITAFTLTPGIWDITAVASVYNGAGGSAFEFAINTTSVTFPAFGDAFFAAIYTWTEVFGCVPVYRAVITANTVFYFVGRVTATGNSDAYGRITATRVG
jgi:hypothetical protein